LLAAYAANPSSWPRKALVEPELEDMKISFSGGDDWFGERERSFWALRIGPVLFVVRGWISGSIFILVD
jgi:hypothetical protein